MEPKTVSMLRELLFSRDVASLATLHEGAPAISMVPYALADDGSGFLIHVSGLAAHTGDLRDDPRCAVMVMAEESDDVSPTALPRASATCEAEEIPRDSDVYEDAKRNYLEWIPDGEPMFGLGDFALFRLRPQGVRMIQGFGQAYTLTPQTFAAAVRRESPPA
jgi:heme iron utilization protein